MNRLLFVDDDTELLALNKTYFTEHSFLADTASDVNDALELIRTKDYDCIILDVCMENRSGFELCAKLRNHTHTPVIFLTVLTDEDSLEKGFYSGGDDYITKPYRMKELELRIIARTRPRQSLDISAPDASAPRLVICPDEKQAYIGDRSLNLTVSEFQILEFLSRHKGTAYRQETIYEALWGESYNTHSIQVLIMRIRRKIKELSPDKDYIRTQWGKGYVFTE